MSQTAPAIAPMSRLYEEAKRQTDAKLAVTLGVSQSFQDQFLGDFRRAMNSIETGRETIMNRHLRGYIDQVAETFATILALCESDPATMRAEIGIPILAKRVADCVGECVTELCAQAQLDASSFARQSRIPELKQALAEANAQAQTTLKVMLSSQDAPALERLRISSALFRGEN